MLQARSVAVSTSWALCNSNKALAASQPCLSNQAARLTIAGTVKMLHASGLTVSQRAFAGTASSRAILKPAQRRLAANCRVRPARLVTQDTLVLVPTGDGSVDHLETPVDMPGMLELKEGTYTIGRSPPADWVIAIPTVSAKHAELKIEGTSVRVTDLNSTNGTFIDEQELEANVENELPLGTEIIFGDSFLAKFALEER